MKEKVFVQKVLDKLKKHYGWQQESFDYVRGVMNSTLYAHSPSDMQMIIRCAEDVRREHGQKSRED